MRLTTVLALVVVSPCACETSRTYVRATGKAPSLVAAVHSQGQQLSRRRQRLTVLTVGAALCNDVLLVLMLVPMLPYLLPPSSNASPLALSCLFSAKDAAQLLCAPVAGAVTLHAGAQRTLTASLIGLACTTCAFAEARGFRGLLAARALQGAASAGLLHCH